MAKFALLFVDGMVPEDKRAQNNKDWHAWLDKLKAAGNLIDGAPFGENSKVIRNQAEIKTYDWHIDSNVGGYCIIEAGTIDEAVKLSLDCPQLRQEYGSGVVEVREIVAA